MTNDANLDEFKTLCAAQGLLNARDEEAGDDVISGICDDGTLLARQYNLEDALQQYRATKEWREANRLLELYETIDVADYEETRKLYTHWTGRRDRNGAPVCWFEVQRLTPEVMAAYNKSCSNVRQSAQTESESMLRLFCTYENLTRFVLPLCNFLKADPDSAKHITSTTCIVDIAGVSLMQFWRLRGHMQAASTLATAHYPETLGQTFVIGAPSFFTTIWGWLNKWFDQNTVSKIRIVPSGRELAVLSELIDPADIPEKYGGSLLFEFGMTPDLDTELRKSLHWMGGQQSSEKLPMGPMRWIRNNDGRKVAVAVGSSNGKARHEEVGDI